MTRTVKCSLCDGARVDANGARCIECQGLGEFDHWKQPRAPEAIEEELFSCRMILHKAQADTFASDELRKETLDYWIFQVAELKAELWKARAEAKGADNGNV